jgi:hypothetical protein
MTNALNAEVPLRMTEAAEILLDARADPRVGVEFPVEIFSGDFPGSLLAAARDLSVGGMCVATQTLVSFKAIRRVCLGLPGGSLDLKAEGRWQAEARGDDSRLTGIRFVDVGKAEQARLWEAVHDASKDLALFLFGRSDLGGVCPDDANSLADCSRYRIVSPRREIYRQDECRPGDDSIFLVVSGEVRLEVTLGDRRRMVLERLKAGRVFGGVSLVADLPNQETAIADSRTSLLEISRASFSYLRIAKPLLGQRLLQLLTRSLLRRNRKLIELVLIER